MTRPHIEFYQTQNQPWVRDTRFPDCEVKVLSLDNETGAYTALQCYPGNLRVDGNHPLCANEEFFVLSGLFHLNGIEYAPGCYGFIPATQDRTDLLALEETVLLRFFDYAPEPFEGQVDAIERANGRPAIPILDTYRMQWDTKLHDVKLAHLGLGRKNLRIDPISGQRTFLFKTSPQTHPANWRNPQESHPTPEECYFLAGDLTGDRGTMQEGAYFWRPPGIPHGPYGSIGGSLSLIRFIEGKHVNIWADDDKVFSYRQAYEPALPDSHMGYAGEMPKRKPF
jgi:hypothetical protein